MQTTLSSPESHPDSPLARAIARDGRFRVVRALPGGWLAESFLVERVSDGAPHVVKVLRAGLGTDLAIRIGEQASAARSGEDGVLVAVREVLPLTGGRLAVVRPYVAGPTLDALPGPLAPREAAELLLPVITALRQNRDAGAHLGLCPTNLVFEEVGGVRRLRVLDHGWVRAVSGMVPGLALSAPLRVRWMAPELLTGHDAGEQTDVWSLGSVFRFLVTGAMPLQDARVPSDLAVLVDTACARRVDERMCDLEAFEEELEIIAVSGPTGAAPAPLTPKDLESRFESLDDEDDEDGTAVIPVTEELLARLARPDTDEPARARSTPTPLTSTPPPVPVELSDTLDPLDNELGLLRTQRLPVLAEVPVGGRLEPVAQGWWAWLRALVARLV